MVFTVVCDDTYFQDPEKPPHPKARAVYNDRFPDRINCWEVDVVTIEDLSLISATYNSKQLLVDFVLAHIEVRCQEYYG